MAILKHIASKSSNYGAALEYLIFKHDELRKTPILDQNGNRIMRDEYYLNGLNCEPYSFDAACQQLNREYQKNKNKNEIKSHHYIISFDPRDSTENCLTGKRAQELGLEYAKANFPGHQALVCTHMDGHNGSGNIHVHIVINSLRKLDVPQQPFMERPIDCKAGYKHHVTNEYLKHLQKSLMDLCQREFLHQVDLLSPSRTGVTEAEYWAQRRLDEKKQEIEKEGFTPNPTKFQTQKQLIRDAVAAAREKAISYEDFQNILQDEYDIFVKTQRGRYSYLPPERNKFISERSLGESCKRECLEGFFVQNAEKNLRYKEDPILIFTTRTRLRLVVDLQENVKAQENLAYALKVKISNLQKMAETLVWVQENNINDLTELNDLCKTAQANAQAAYERLSQAEDELYKTNEQIHYAGLHVINPEVLEFVGINADSEGKVGVDGKPVKVDLDRQLLKPLAGTGKMFCYDSPEYVKDMGTPERYYSVCKDCKEGRISAKNLKNKQKAIFLDRDGTINKYVGFLRNIDDFELIDGVAEAIRKINESGYLAVVVTNQPVVARGEVSFEELEEIHNKMETLLGKEGAYLDAIYYCPHIKK